MVAHWRKQGLQIFMFLDDGTGAGTSFESASHAAGIIRSELAKAGWLVNESKSDFTPRQKVEALGHMIDSISNRITVTEARVKYLKELLLRVPHLQAMVPAWHLAKILGSIVSMWLALGNITCLQTRSLQSLIASTAQVSWNAHALVTAAAFEEIEFWKTNFDGFHGQPIWYARPRLITPAWSDASESGWGGFCLKDGMVIARGDWPFQPLARNGSSTLKELFAARYTLVSLRHKLADQQVSLNTDNQNVVRILCSGSTKAHLQEQAVTIFQFCIVNKTRLFAQWVPRDMNVTADYLSRIVDDDGWKLDASLFDHFNSKWGPFMVDRFASHLSAQLPRFNSRWWSPG